MKKMHPFFVIGTIGMIVTAVLHMFLALALAIPTTHAAFLVMYPVFAAFLSIGFALTLKEQKAVS